MSSFNFRKYAFPCQKEQEPVRYTHNFAGRKNEPVISRKNRQFLRGVFRVECIAAYLRHFGISGARHFKRYVCGAGKKYRGMEKNRLPRNNVLRSCAAYAGKMADNLQLRRLAALSLRQAQYNPCQNVQSRSGFGHGLGISAEKRQRQAKYGGHAFLPFFAASAGAHRGPLVNGSAGYGQGNFSLRLQS